MRLLLAALLVLVASGCTQVFFQPHRHIVSTPGLYGIEYQPVEFKAEDGTAPFAWFLPARGAPRGGSREAKSGRPPTEWSTTSR